MDKTKEKTGLIKCTLQIGVEPMVVLGIFVIIGVVLFVAYLETNKSKKKF